MRQKDGSYLYEELAMHMRGGLPAGREPLHTATHIGMFVAWCWLSGLGQIGEMIMRQSALDRVRCRGVTPGAFFYENFDGRFTDRLLNEEGNGFTRHYYIGDERSYLDDYFAATKENHPTLLHWPDTWARYDALSPLIDYKLVAWRARSI